MRAACTVIAKNEEFYIDEWAAYHLLIGFDHIYIYDNNDDPAQLHSAKFIWGCSDIDIIRFPGRNKQIASYKHSLAHHSGLYDYMAFIDIDEFILPVGTKSIKPLLESYSHIHTIGLTWSNFGHSGHISRPAGLVIDNYAWSYPIPSPQIKSITRLKNPDRLISQHNVDLDAKLVSGMSLKGEDRLDEDEILKGCDDIFIAHNTIRINHYITRSLQDLQEKCDRGSVAADAYQKRNFDWYYGVANRYNSRLSLEISQLVLLIIESSPACKVIKFATQWLTERKGQLFDTVSPPFTFDDKWYASSFLEENSQEHCAEDILQHWQATGIRKGYEWSEQEYAARHFNAAAYRRLNSDLFQLSDKESYIHFLLQGRFENRTSSEIHDNGDICEKDYANLINWYSQSLLQLN